MSIKFSREFKRLCRIDCTANLHLSDTILSMLEVLFYFTYAKTNCDTHFTEEGGGQRNTGVKQIFHSQAINKRKNWNSDLEFKPTWAASRVPGVSHEMMLSNYNNLLSTVPPAT